MKFKKGSSRIVVAINGTLQKQQPEVDPVTGLLAQIISAAGQEEPEGGNSEKKRFRAAFRQGCYNHVV